MSTTVQPPPPRRPNSTGSAGGASSTGPGATARRAQVKTFLASEITRLEEKLSRLEAKRKPGAKKSPASVALEQEIQAERLQVDEVQRASDAGNDQPAERLVATKTQAIKEQFKTVSARIERKRDGRINVISKWIMDWRNELGGQMDAAMDEARAQMVYVTGHPVADVNLSALAAARKALNLATTVADDYDTDRADFVEDKVSNVATPGLRLALEPIYRQSPETRWDRAFIQGKDGKEKINFWGILKEYGLYEVVSTVLRLAIVGGDFSPANRETAPGFFMEAGAGAVATGGTLLTAMAIKGTFRNTRLEESKVADFLVRTAASCIFGGLAGYLSYWGMPADARGGGEDPKEQLWTATKRGMRNGPIRLGAPEGVIALWDWIFSSSSAVDAVRGNIMGTQTVPGSV